MSGIIQRLARPRVGALIALAAGLFAACSDPPKPDFEFFDACDPRQAPDAECYASKRAPSSPNVALATEIAHRFIDEHPASEQDWNWEEGVLMYAMTELYRVTGETAIRDYYEAWIDHHLAEGWGISWSDSCPPALAAIALYAETGDEAYAAVPIEVLRFLEEDALRTEQGGISHMGTLNVRTLWIDSLFMFGMVLTRWGEFDDDDDALDEMRDQLDIFATLLQSDSGLFVHAYEWPLTYDTDIYWGRGNSWVTIAAADYLRARTLRYEEDLRASEILARQIDGVLAAQDADTGLWWSIMNRPDEVYLETSATALFTYGMIRAYRYGLVDDRVLAPATAAMEGLQGTIARDADDRPYVTGISGPTSVGTFDEYSRVPLEDDLSYGVGGVILALIETSGLL